MQFHRWFIVSLSIMFVAAIAALAFSLAARADNQSSLSDPPLILRQQCSSVMDTIAHERAVAGEKYVSARVISHGYRFDFINKTTGMWTGYFVISDYFRTIDQSAMMVYGPCAVKASPATVYVTHWLTMPGTLQQGFPNGQVSGSGLN